MKAWTITEPRNIELVTQDSEAVTDGCVKVRITQCLIARPSIQTYNGGTGSYPIIPGNACCGLVVETGENVKALQRGDRVFIGAARFCGECVLCKTDKQLQCENLTYRGINCDGFARDFIVVREEDCTTLPERVTDDDAIFLSYISTAINLINSIEVERGEHLAIYGAGVLGNILAQVALYYQAVPILIDIDAAYLEKAQKMGVYYTINAVDSDPRNKIFHITGGKMAECAAHIVSDTYDAKQTLSLVGQGGRVGIIGRMYTDNELICSLKPILSKQLTVKGITGGLKYMQVAVNMLANKAVNVAPLVTREITFEELPEVLEQASQKLSTYTKIIMKNKIL